MSYLNRLMTQTATHWHMHATAPYDSYGDAAFVSSAPRLLTPKEGLGVRWDDKVVKFINTSGDEDFGRATVWSATTQFSVGDYLYLGTSTAANPETVSGAARVKMTEKTVDTSGKFTLYKAVL